MNVTGDEETFQRQLKVRFNLNARGANGNTALILAAERGDNFPIDRCISI